MASEKITAMIEEVKSLTVLELNELVKALEEEFGVSAAAPWRRSSAFPPPPWPLPPPALLLLPLRRRPSSTWC